METVEFKPGTVCSACGRALEQEYAFVAGNAFFCGSCAPADASPASAVLRADDPDPRVIKVRTPIGSFESEGYTVAGWSGFLGMVSDLWKSLFGEGD